MSKKYEKIWDVLSVYQFEISVDDLTEVCCVICGKILVDATQGPCGCRYCRRCIEKHLEQEPKKCVGSKSECGEELLNFSRDIQTDHRANIMVSSLKVTCANVGCSFSADLMQIAEHMQHCGGVEVACLYRSMGCDSSDITESTMTTHLNENIVHHSRLSIDWMGHIKNEAFENTKRIQILEEVLNNLKAEIERQARIIEIQKNSLELCVTRLGSGSDTGVGREDFRLVMEKINNITKMITSENEYIWKVDNMSEKVKEARMGVRSVVYSEPFYSHKHGYKLRLSMHPNGTGFKEGTHLYVLFCVMKGDYDDLLSWPLTRTVTLSIVNRNDGTDFCSYRFSYHDTEPPFRGSFMKPMTNFNMAMGNDEFVSLDVMFKYQSVLRDDSVLIKCTMSHPLS